MHTFDFGHPSHVHFIGIGGISMSGLAEILMDKGFSVSGSDNRASELTKHLEERGALVYIGQRASNIPGDTAAVVYTAAVHPDNEEYAAAVSRGLPLLSRAELLGSLMRNYRTSIAVAGTHGKTTTTSMAASILMAGGYDPTISVGGMLPSIGGNIRVGGTDVFLTEACEYTNSFLSFYPTAGLILNIEEDHLDFFRDLDDIRHSFRLFAENIPSDGVLVISSDIQSYQDITMGLPCRVVTFGRSTDADYTYSDAEYDGYGRASFTLIRNGAQDGRFTLSVPGEHNILNALAAAALSDALGIDRSAAVSGLASFSGTDRRFQYKGKVCGFTVIDDYAHHPTEIRATLNAAARCPHNEIWCVFQPHTYSRTRAFLHEFADALALSDHVVLADIYAARETDTLGMSSALIRDLLREKGVDAYYFPSFGEIEQFLSASCREGDICITMGAGNVVDIGEDLVRGQGERQ